MYVIADMNTGEKLLRADTRDELIEKAIKINEDSDFDLFGFTYIGKEKKAPIKESKFVWIFLDKVNENYIAIFC